MADNQPHASETAEAKAPDEAENDDREERVGFAFLRLLFYTRFSLMAGGILMLLGILPWLIPEPTITAVYVQSTPLRLGTLTLLSFLAAALVIMTFRTTLYNAADRFEDASMERFAEATKGWIWNFRRFSWLLLGAPLPLMSLWYTWGEIHSSGGANPLQFVLALAGGFVAALLLLMLLACGHRRLVTANVHDPRFFPFDFSRDRKELDQKSWKATIADPAAKRRPLARPSLQIGRKIAGFLSWLGLRDGYVTETKVWVKGEPEPQPARFPAVGHGPLTLFTLALLGLNLLVLYFGPWTFRHWGWAPSDRGPFGTLFYLVGLVMVFMGVLPGVSFFLDRYRIPTSWVFLGTFFLLTISCWLFPDLMVDHKYAVAPEPLYAPNEEIAREIGPGVDVKISDEFLASPISLAEVIEG